MSEIKQLTTDILVIGGGAAGIAVAANSARAGRSVVLVDRRAYLGGILPQCIHHGFGLGVYGEDLTGPEYLERQLEGFRSSGATYIASATVLEVSQDRYATISSSDGLCQIHFEHCVLATGCRERTLYSLGVAGTRPQGIYTAGEAQELINLAHQDIGNRIFILGSGDIGQIMARRFSLLGKTVVGIAEIRSELGGIKRNREECIEAFNIPVLLNSTITEVRGYPTLTGATVRHIDSGANEFIECDTLITALGLIPDRSLAEPLAKDGKYPSWLHFCGNANYVHEIVDTVTSEGMRLGATLRTNTDIFQKV